VLLRVISCVWWLLLVHTGCSDADRRAERVRPVHSTQAPVAVAPELPARDGWAQKVASEALEPSAPGAAERKIEPSTLLDPDYAGSELVGVRRVVYRVTIAVPAHLRPSRPPVAPPAGELLLDVGDHRLRARFVGPGWPVPDGSEVRLRGDVPGVYLFDADGGRALSPGQLSTWFEGYSAGMRTRSELLILKDYNPAPSEGPGDLLCAFLAEWTGNPRDEVLRRCTGFLPPGFRFGVWSAELTAIVQTSVPRYELRADNADPPRLWPRRPDAQLIEPAALARVRALPRARAEAPAAPAAVSGEAAARLGLENHTPARMVAVVQGVPVGWVDAFARVQFTGLAQGTYEVAALRTSTGSVQAAGQVSVPGELIVARSQQPLDVLDARTSALLEAAPPAPAGAD
jgi:hypothetical protein